MNLKKKTLVIIIGTFSFFSLATAIYNFYGNGIEIDGAGGLNDTFNLSNNSLVLYDNNSNEYLNENKRFYLGVDTLFVSNHYGDFKIKTGTKFTAYKKNIKSPACVDSAVSYYFSGTLSSPAWGDLDVMNINTNYYCPRSRKISLPLTSLITGKMLLTYSPSEENVILVDSYGITQTGTLSNVFDNKKLSINGSYVGEGEDLKGELSESLDIVYGEEIQSETNKFQFNKNINKNISYITRNITPETSNQMSSFNSKEIYFYDYENTPNAAASNVGNKGKILTLGNGGPINAFSKIEVDGGKTIILKGGNIYINADIYNKDKDSLLVIVVKRSYSDRENGGNIYISPNVTNIDAILIADGSILNFDGTNVLSIEDGDSGSLKRQLLIYGSIFSSNTIGENKSIYGTDEFIANGEVIKGKYNLENLRTFQPVLSSGLDLLDNCYDIDNKVIALGPTGTSSIEYAFAGKRRCNTEDILSTDLRGTNSFARVVVRYNPKVGDSDLRILQINN